jgi:hypothetical protein
MAQVMIKFVFYIFIFLIDFLKIYNKNFLVSEIIAN